MFSLSGLANGEDWDKTDYQRQVLTGQGSNRQITQLLLPPECNKGQLVLLCISYKQLPVRVGVAYALLLQLVCCPRGGTRKR